MIEMTAELIKDCEAVGVDIAPVVDAATLEPFGPAQHLESVSGAEDDQALLPLRKGQKVDLILGNE